jgi:hypothetical protein
MTKKELEAQVVQLDDARELEQARIMAPTWWVLPVNLYATRTWALGRTISDTESPRPVVRSEDYDALLRENEYLRAELAKFVVAATEDE